MKAILIDPFNETVTAVEYSGDFRDIYKLIHAHTFDVATISRRDGIFVDDEGLLHNPTHFFLHDEYPSHLAGRGLIIGCNDHGESEDCKTTVEEVKAKVKFQTIHQVRARYLL